MPLTLSPTGRLELMIISHASLFRGSVLESPKVQKITKSSSVMKRSQAPLTMITAELISGCHRDKCLLEIEQHTPSSAGICAQVRPRDPLKWTAAVVSGNKLLSYSDDNSHIHIREKIDKLLQKNQHLHRKPTTLLPSLQFCFLSWQQSSHGPTILGTILFQFSRHYKLTTSYRPTTFLIVSIK